MNKDQNPKVVTKPTTQPSDIPNPNLQQIHSNKRNSLKKIIVFSAMGIVFISYIYLLFKPNNDTSQRQDNPILIGVPEATNMNMPTNKTKAYEQEILEEKEQEKRKAIAQLSDYWTGEEEDFLNVVDMDQDQAYPTAEKTTGDDYSNSAQNSYRSMQNTIDNFYQEDTSQTVALQRELEVLKQQLAQQNENSPDPVQTQLALMEKSYEMAAKYLPTSPEHPPVPPASPEQKKSIFPMIPTKKNAISSLYQPISDSSFIAQWSQTRNREFYTVGASQTSVPLKNSIQACIHLTQTITGEASVKIRLLEPAQTKEYIIPQGTLVTAQAKFQAERLQLHLNSIEIQGHILTVDLSAYDLDGQQGLLVPYSPERSTLNEVAGTMSQNTGTSVMLTQSAGQQAAADLSRGLVQGISGYFSKKVRAPKVTLNAGHQLLLVSKQ